MSDKVTDKQAAAQKQIATHLASASAGSFFLSFFMSFIFPVLPALLLQAAPQLKGEKAQKILKLVDDELDQLIGEA